MAKQLKEAVIVACGRSAIARGGKGSLKDTHPVDFAAQVLKGTLDRVPGLDRALIDDLILGCAKPEGVQGSNVARQVVQRAGLPDSVAGQTVNRFCASGLQSIASASYCIQVGQAEVMLAGGLESMTAIPMGSPKEYQEPWNAEHTDVYMPMGLTAERVAEKYGVTRLEMEQMAVESHAKASAAQESGAFDWEIVPIKAKGETGEPVDFKTDEGVRKGTNLEKLATLKPSFKEDGLVTAATASQVSDGTGFVVLMDADKAASLGIKPLARFVGFSVAGVPAGIMGIGPVYAVPKVMAQTGLTVDDMDVIEINEAFAAQAIPCIRELKLPTAKVNPRGGAIALGHPLGATGAILTCKAISYLRDNGGRYGLITMCVGGGMGAAGIIEKL
ncbi:MAG: thiolase family protein [Lachnospiraceae bacterium]|jgi:acetyl-CoA acyltransferase|nr:thiolase family protein [Lachnospiraceae bacterium]